MKKYLWLLAFGFSVSAHAYSANELQNDCQAADDFYTRHTDPEPSLKATRCISYVMGVADGYAVSDFLAEKVGVKLNAFCLPKESDLPRRLVRATLAQLEHTAPNSTASTATLVAGGFARTFPCTDSLEPKK